MINAIRCRIGIWMLLFIAPSVLMAQTTLSQLQTKYPAWDFSTATLTEVSSRAALDTALASAGSAQVFLLKAGADETAWQGDPLTLSVDKQWWFIGDLDAPATLHFPIAVTQGTIGLANFTIRGATVPTTSLTLRAPGLYVSGGSVTGYDLILTQCTATARCLASGVACAGGTTTLYDCFITENTNVHNLSAPNNNFAVYRLSGTLSMTRCYIINNRSDKGSLAGVAGDPEMTECEVAAALNYDPGFVVLSSGADQLYLGWQEVIGMKSAWVEILQNEQWVTADDLVMTPAADALEGLNEKEMMPTVEGWHSARHLNLAPGTTHTYRLAYTTKLDEAVHRSESLSATTVTLENIPQLHSRQEAKLRLYLDFTGYVFDGRGNVKNAQLTLGSATTYVQTAPFVYTGGDKETQALMPTATAIRRIWAMVAEDFAPFDIDVTTEAPPLSDLQKTDAEDERYGIRAVIGFTRNSEGNLINWFPGGGGVSSWGTFNSSCDIPLFVFADASCQNIAAQVTHEAGHTLGLNHDGGRFPVVETFDSYTWRASDYYRGHELTLNGQLNTSAYYETHLRWFPIMGAAPTSTPGGNFVYDDYDYINQWSKGDYTEGNSDEKSKRADGTEEDDLAILLGLWKGQLYRTGLTYDDYGLRLLPDDAGDEPAKAHALRFTDREKATFEGIISKHIVQESVTEDVDCFAFTQYHEGRVTLEVVPNFQGFTRGASLNAKLELLTAAGEPVAESSLPLDTETIPIPIREAALSQILPAGNYILRISGTVHPLLAPTPPEDSSVTEWHINDATAYGSIGPYTLTVTRQAHPELSLRATQALDTLAASLPTAAIASPLTMAQCNAALECFTPETLCTVKEGQLTIDYTFTVTDIRIDSEQCTVTVQARNSENTPIDIRNDIDFAVVTPGGETLYTQSRTALTPLANGAFSLTFPQPQSATATLFSIRLIPPTAN